MPTEDVRRELEAIRHEIQVWGILLKGSETFGPGIIDRLKEMERLQRQCEERNTKALEAFRKEVENYLEVILEKQNSANTKITEQMIDFHEWRHRLMAIVNFATHKNLWKAIGIIIFIGMTLISWNKLGFKFFYDLIRDAIK